ncbi:DUF6221 family protein [Streptomyces sp. NRRL S-920]|uniref:DUF6221 family protein n=1 Tax=Streptomyces sp. NRRL S-920 TaxID=1463921 RepID=UPI0004C7836A|nr:DUF6221 family protein [Streptomyces sp. NRRL S-920]
MTADLPVFLRARLMEDQEIAADAAVAGWDRDAVDEGNPVARHVVRHGPARVLADAAARRRLVDMILAYEAKIDGEWGCLHGAKEIEEGRCPETNPDEIEALRLLAVAYDGHPDYREEWRP